MGMRKQDMQVKWSVSSAWEQLTSDVHVLAWSPPALTSFIPSVYSGGWMSKWSALHAGQIYLLCNDRVEYQGLLNSPTSFPFPVMLHPHYDNPGAGEKHMGIS